MRDHHRGERVCAAEVCVAERCVRGGSATATATAGSVAIAAASESVAAAAAAAGAAAAAAGGAAAAAAAGAAATIPLVRQCQCRLLHFMMIVLRMMIEPHRYNLFSHIYYKPQHTARNLNHFSNTKIVACPCAQNATLFLSAFPMIVPSLFW